MVYRPREHSRYYKGCRTDRSFHIMSNGPDIFGGNTCTTAGSNGNDVQPEEQDDDEVYQYPRAGLGPVFASIESLLRW